MKKLLSFTCFAIFGFLLSGQEVLNLSSDFFPNSLDSNNFYYYAGVSYIMPRNETTNFQQKTLGPGTLEGNRFFQGEMEMLFFTSFKTEKRIQPHIFYRAEVYPSQYLSTRFGFGISDKKLSSSFGIFAGNYFRRVPYDSNFITRRKRTFEHYPLSGFYLQSASESASLIGVFAFEKRRMFHSVKVSGRFGNSLAPKSGIWRSLEFSLLSESFTGAGLGPSIVILPRTRLEVLWIVPNKDEEVEQARLRNKLTRGFMFSLGHYVN